ncbi:MAG: lysine--tRNA ligase [Bdellovibrio sp.]|nr:lysine--tRNA ligase [Bdellovibrio sp.]
MASNPNDNEQAQIVHWADMTADRIIKQKGDKGQYVLASGITPSGVVHFGNFRETITVDFVARALRARGKKVRFIFSWDDYDTFRKIPANMPKQEELKKYLFQPIVDTPDPFDRDESYAAHHEKNYEAQLEKVGIEVEAIYQAKKYKKGDYKDQIKLALSKRQVIVDILNKHRAEPLDDSWMPVNVYCSKCNRDKTDNIKWDGNWEISYRCELCGHQGSENLQTTSRAKLPWRVDWPMRWVYESVDFEPGGKDHSSEGGSYTTAQEIVKEVFGGTSPVYLQYDFVSIKGRGGKMSSSKGDLVTVNDVLNIYEPEMVRWIFASYKSNVDFAISFDLDVIKTYEDFDRQERLAYGLEAGNDKKVAMAKRVIELSQIGPMPKECPFQPSFRHLCNVLQINDGDIKKTRVFYAQEIKNERDERRFQERSLCALHWLKSDAPDEFKFTLNRARPCLDLTQGQTDFIRNLYTFLEKEWDNLKSDKELHEKLYEVIHAIPGFEPMMGFTTLYQILISREKGPKLASFILAIGKERVLNLLAS